MSTIKLRRSDQAGNVPLTGNLALGEVALNTTDGKLFFKKSVSGTESIVTLQPLPSGGSYGQVLALDSGNNPTWINTSAAGLTVRNTLGNGGAVTNTVSSVTAINFDYNTGMHITDQGQGNVFVSLGSGFKTIQVDGQSDVVALGEDTLKLIAGTGIALATNPTAPKSITISSTGTSTPIKTFNVLGSFGILTGTARFYPVSSDTIKTVILSVGTVVTQDLTLALFRDGQFVQTFTIQSGTIYNKYNNLSIPIQTGESYTVNIISGAGTNLSMGLYNINL
jgi:hypothetical protein